LAALAVVAFYFVVDEYSWSLARRWESEGDRIERALARSSARKSLVTPDLVRSVSVFGPVEPPGTSDQDRIELGNAINEIFKRHHVTASSFDSRAAQRLKDPEGIVFGGIGIDRVQAEVKFEVTPEELPKVLAEIEAHPAIEAISTLRLQRTPDATKRMQVQATIEAWVQASRGNRRRS
ncbi:MAG: hypothetical protein JNK53_03070, partial [Phycisphaerae bacterium]|nr:hypothetical protein [Phycisphaerae bacterium]